jgi:putative nucleotidyltransferase with HDIG domain
MPSSSPFSPRTPPRLVVRTLLATLLAVLVVLVVVATVLTVDARRRAERTVERNLDTGLQAVRVLETQRLHELRALASASAGREPLAEALADLGTAPLPEHPSPAAIAVARELHEMADRGRLDAVAILDAGRRVLGAVGRYSRHWPSGDRIEVPSPIGTEADVARLARRTAFRVQVMPILHRGEVVGELQVADAIDERHALSLAALTRASIGVVVGQELVAASLSPRDREVFRSLAAMDLPERGTVRVGDERYAVRELLRLGPLRVYALDSLTAATRAATQEALGALVLVSIGALLAAGIASFWLARSLARPIGELSRSLSEMAHDRRPGMALPRSGSSRELDALTDTFNELFASLEAAEGATQSAYVGAIRGLAAALDARDPYTAGHSERVSALSVAIGRQLELPHDDLDVLRLGALLHDIGKIGLSDHVLRKPGTLTAEEFEAIKAHPRLGARILRSVPFLAPHLPIVELHHERPDGLGYPHGLAGDEVPLPARIVKVADAFDAMTSARAYRPARAASDAIAELWHCSGSQFDTAVVEAFVAAWPHVAAAFHRSDEKPLRLVALEPEPHAIFLGHAGGSGRAR